MISSESTIIYRFQRKKKETRGQKIDFHHGAVQEKMANTLINSPEGAKGQRSGAKGCGVKHSGATI